jgi:hypothetical protein
MKTFILCALLLNSHTVFADEADDLVKAIEKTQADLTNPKTREAMINTADSKKVAEQVKKLSGSSGNEQEMYSLASDVLNNMKGLSQEQLTKIIEQAQKDPEGFVKTWTPEQKKKLESIAERTPAAASGKRP